MLNVSPIPAFNDNYIWLLNLPDSIQAVVVDPGDAEPVLRALAEQELELAAILITHHHADHIGGVDELLLHYDVPVYGPAQESIPSLTHQLNDGDIIHIEALDTHFDVLFIPGHTSGHIAYYGDEKLFCGDTLFAAGCGRLFEGTAAQMHESLSRIASLPSDTQFYCAHEYTTANLNFARAVEPENQDIEMRINHVKQLRQENSPSVPASLATELKTNPFLRSDISSVKLAAENHVGRALNNPVDVFAAVRKWKDNF